MHSSLFLLSLTFQTLLATADTVSEPSPSQVNYDGHQVFRIAVQDDGSHLRKVLKRHANHASVWKPVSKRYAFSDVVIAPRAVKSFLEDMTSHDVQVMHNDLGKSIREERKYAFYQRKKSSAILQRKILTVSAGSANETWFNSYHPYEHHVTWMNDIVSEYCQNSITVTSGKTAQGATITGLHIFGSSGGGQKPAIILHGTVHAREWIVSKVVEYMAYQLLKGYGTDKELTALVDKYDFYMFPIINVDGFNYSWTTDRMWRKNRQTIASSECIGRDINRNWNFKWANKNKENTNIHPCDDKFPGLEAADADETKAVVAFMQDIKQKQGLKLFMDYHSYSQLFMTPYAYDCNVRPQNHNELLALAKGAVDAIYAVNGTPFKYGPICNTIYPASGSSVDYVNDVIKADYTFVAELRDQGNYGFLLPANQIVPSGRETFAGFRYLLENMK